MSLATPSSEQIAPVTAAYEALAERGVLYITLAHLFWRRIATNTPALPFLPDALYNLLFPQKDVPPLTDLGQAAVRACERAGGRNCRAPGK